MNQQNLKPSYNTNNVWEDLVISILSVNQYTLSKTYLTIESMRKIGLFNPDTALPAITQYSFYSCPLLSKLSDLGMYLIAAVSAVI